jgi:hypothetical protein
MCASTLSLSGGVADPTSERAFVIAFINGDEPMIKTATPILKRHFGASNFKHFLLHDAKLTTRSQIPRLAERHLPCLLKWLMLHDPDIRKILLEQQVPLDLHPPASTGAKQTGLDGAGGEEEQWIRDYPDYENLSDDF